MASRSDDLKTIASFVGNAAAHRAVYGENAFTIREASLYEGMADKIARMRNWNDEELQRLATKSKREARNIMKQRKSDWRDKTFETLCFLVDRDIDKFIERTRKRKRKSDE